MSVRARVDAALLNRHAHNCTHQEGPTMPTDPLSSPVETTDGSARPIPPEEANGLTSGPESRTGVIPGAKAKAEDDTAIISLLRLLKVADA